jgi:hypothetical protein
MLKRNLICLHTAANTEIDCNLSIHFNANLRNIGFVYLRYEHTTLLYSNDGTDL